MKYLRRFQLWLDGYLPLLCVRCGRLCFSKDARPARTTLGPVVKVCKPCYLDLYGEEHGTRNFRN